MKATAASTAPNHYKEALLSVRETLDILGGKWKVPIILSLACGDKRFKEIRNHIPGITPKVLSQELKMLQTNNLVEKIADVDSSVGYYTLTKKCESLKKVIHGLKEWGDFHRTATFQRTIKTKAIPW